MSTSTETDVVDEVKLEESTDVEETSLEESGPMGPDPDDEPDTFPRSVVEDLRKEAATYRTKAKDRDELAHRLHAAMVAATGRLADPTDLDFDEDHIGDEDALNAALDELLAAKPHLASRRPRGDVGQGVSGVSETVDLAGILRSRA